MRKKKSEVPKNKDSLPSTPKKKINTRRRGLDFERKVARIFREQLGFEFCKTSREVSRVLDACKIDLGNIPYNVQLKRGYAKSRPKAEQIFSEMEEEMKKRLPPDDPHHGYSKILIHSIDGQHKYHTLVTMCAEDWIKLVQKAENVSQKGPVEEESDGGDV